MQKREEWQPKVTSKYDKSVIQIVPLQVFT